jgi:hypothetical protein
MTDQHAFNKHPHVCAFTEWATQHFPVLPISFDFSASWAVPGGLREDVLGLQEALTRYIWKSEGADSGNWAATVALLGTFHERLRHAIDLHDEDAAFEVCKAIIQWGGDRNPERGALPFLLDLTVQKKLVGYLATARADFALAGAKLGGELRVSKMNSMLTKVHAMASNDGLPIYDSRVAAAIAALVEMWRRLPDSGAQTLPELLAFPATLPSRTVRHFDPNAIAPGVLLYGKAHERRTARRWGEAKIRLGWLMQKILLARQDLFVGTLVERMHAFEASLFMVGYDVACLNP